MANFSSPTRCGPRSSFWSGARWARSSTSTSPSSPRVQVTKQTAAPSDTYLAIVTPLLIVSSSGCAWTNMSRRAGRDVTSEFTAPPYAVLNVRSGALHTREISSRDDHPRLSEVTGRIMCRFTIGTLDQQGFLNAADFLRFPAAGMEPARRRRVGWARHITGQHYLFTDVAQGWIGQGHSRQQGLRVRVGGSGVDLVLISHLHDLAEIHHANPIRDVPND